MQILSDPIDFGREDVRTALRKQCDSDEPLRCLTARKLLELINWLEARGPEPQFFASLHRDQLWLFPLEGEGLISLWLDRNDYAPLQDGQIQFHVRLQYRPPDSALSVERRATDPEQVEWYLHEAVLRLRKRKR